jgi:hypothetical protein
VNGRRAGAACGIAAWNRAVAHFTGAPVP